MRAHEFLSELVTRANDITHFRRRIALAAQLCTRLGDRPLVFRAFKHAQASTTFLAKVSHDDWARPQERKAGSNRQAQLELMQRLGIEHPTFCTLTPPLSSSEFHGQAHIFIPLDLSPPWWSKRVQDLGASRILDQQGQPQDGGATSRGSHWVGWMNDRVDEFADTYVHAWPDAYTDHELIFDAGTYYLLEMENFFTRFAGAELKSAMPKYVRGTRPGLFKAIDPQVWDRVKTYSDVAEFLMTTAPEYLDWYEHELPKIKQNQERQADLYHQVNTAWQQGGGFQNPRSWAQVAQDQGVPLTPDGRIA